MNWLIEINEIYDEYMMDMKERMKRRFVDNERHTNRQ